MIAKISANPPRRIWLPALYYNIVTNALLICDGKESRSESIVGQAWEERQARDQCPARTEHQKLWKRWIAENATPAIAADAGIVRIHAQTMSCIRPQRTALTRWMLPTPAIDPAIT